MIGPAADIGSPSEVAETVSGGWLDLTGVGGILPSGLEVDADLVPIQPCPGAAHSAVPGAALRGD